MANWYYVIGHAGNLSTPFRGQAGNPLELILRTAPGNPAGSGGVSSLVVTVQEIHQSPTGELTAPPSLEIVKSRPIPPPRRLVLTRTLREQAKRETNPANRKALKNNIRLIQG